MRTNLKLLLPIFTFITFLKKMCRPRPLLSLFSSFQQLTVNIININFLPMTGFEPRIFGIGSNRSANIATATAHFTFITLND